MANLAAFGGAGERHHVSNLPNELDFEPVRGGCEFDPFDKSTEDAPGFVAQGRIIQGLASCSYSNKQDLRCQLLVSASSQRTLGTSKGLRVEAIFTASVWQEMVIWGLKPQQRDGEQLCAETSFVHPQGHDDTILSPVVGDRTPDLFHNPCRELAAESGRTAMDFYGFIWEYLLDDREITDLKKEWKALDIPPR